MSEPQNMPPCPVPPKTMSNALAIWAIVTSVTCNLVGLILGIIGLNKYPAGTSGRTMSMIATILGGLFTLLGLVYSILKRM